MSRLLFAGVASLLLGGCSILPESEPVDIYRLNAPAVDGAAAAREFGAPTVMISLPTANRTLGGQDIMVAQPNQSMAVAAGARWAAPGRNLVQDYIIETFEAQARSVAPIRPGDGIAGDYDLSIDLRRFEAEYDQGVGASPVVHVSAGARLISSARDLEGSTVFSATARAGANTMRDIVAAFDAATGEVAVALAAWTEENVRRAQQRIAQEGPDGARDTDIDVDAQPGSDVEIDVNVQN